MSWTDMNGILPLENHLLPTDDVNYEKCTTLSFPYCCMALTYSVSSTISPHLNVYSSVMAATMTISLLFVLLILQRRLNNYFSLYLRLVIIFLVNSILFLMIHFTPMVDLMRSYLALAIIHRYIIYSSLAIFDWWLLCFFFQSDLSKDSVIRATKLLLLVFCLNVIIEGIAWLISKDFFWSNFASDLVILIINLIIMARIYLETENTGRKAITWLAIYNVIVYGLRVIDAILRLIGILNLCPTLLENTLWYTCYSLLLVRVVSIDSEHWRYGIEALQSERNWLVATNVVRDTQRVKDFPRILLKDIFKDTIIGEGGYSIVYKGTWSGTKVALKELKTNEWDEDRKKQLIQELISESQMLKALRHPNIVQFLGFIAEPPTFGIVTEFMENGSLYHILRDIKRKKKVPLSEGLRVKLLIDISKGMNFLHSHDPTILHRDLKSMNVLVTADMQAKIADMGLSRIQTASHSRFMSLVGTPHWAAPEVLTKEKYNEKADIWSFGVIVWEIVTYERPYPNKKKQQIIDDAKENVTPTIPHNCEPFYTKLMSKCWRVPSNTRPSFGQILSKLIAYQESLGTVSLTNSLAQLPVVLPPPNSENVLNSVVETRYTL